MAKLQSDVAPNLGMTWSDLTRLVAAESPIILSNKDPLIAPRKIITLPEGDEKVRSDFAFTSLREEINDILNTPRFPIQIKGVNPTDHPTLEATAHLLGITKQIVKSSHTFHAEKIDMPTIDRELLGKPIHESDEQLVSEITGHQSIIEALQLNHTSNDIDTDNSLLIAKLENLIKLKKSALSVSKIAIKANSNITEKASRVLMQSDIPDNTERAKRAARAQRLYYLLAKSPKTNNALSLRLTQDIIKVASETRLHFFIEKLQKKNISLAQIVIDIQTITENTIGLGKHEVAEQVLASLSPIIRMITKSKHQELGNTSTSMGAIAEKASICASKSRLLADILSVIPSVNTHEVFPIIRNDDGQLGHELVGITIGDKADTYIEIDPSCSPDPSRKIQQRAGCLVNIYEKIIGDKVKTKDLITGISEAATSEVFLTISGEIAKYRGKDARNGHKYVQLNQVFPNSTYNQAAFTENYLNVIDKFDLPISRTEKSLLLHEEELLLLWNLISSPSPNTYDMLTELYQNDDFLKSTNKNNLQTYINRGLYCSYRYLQANPFDISAYEKYINCLEKFYPNDNLMENNSKRAAIYCEITRIINQARQVKFHSKYQQSVLKRIETTLINPIYSSEAKHLEEITTNKRFYIETTADYIFNPNISPNTSHALLYFE